MPDVSSRFVLGNVNPWTTQQAFSLWMPKCAHPVGVVATAQGPNLYSLEVICIQSTTADMTTEQRHFTATNTSAGGQSLMYIGSVQFQDSHTHQVDIGQTALYDAKEQSDHPNSVSHSHSHSTVTGMAITTGSPTLLLFEIGSD